MQLSNETLPRAMMTFKFFNNLSSFLKKVEQLDSSLFKGLSSGGTHFRIFVI